MITPKELIKKRNAITGLHYGNYIQEDKVIELMEEFAQERVKNCSIPAVSGELAAFREWSEDHYGKGYHDMVWEEWEKYHAANYR